MRSYGGSEFSIAFVAARRDALPLFRLQRLGNRRPLVRRRSGREGSRDPRHGPPEPRLAPGASSAAGESRQHPSAGAQP